MRQNFTVTTPAADPSLLTIEQLRAAAGVTDQSRDDELEALGLALSADIAAACNVAADGIHVPTLRRETITESFWHRGRCDEVFLSRRFVSAVATLTEVGTVLVSDDFIVDREAGMLHRLSGGRPWAWPVGALSVVYQAGFQEVPADLAAIASDLARLRLSSAAVDPLERSRSEEVEGIGSTRIDRWVGSTPGANEGGAVPADIFARLTRFRSLAIG